MTTIKIPFRFPISLRHKEIEQCHQDERRSSYLPGIAVEKTVFVVVILFALVTDAGADVVLSVAP